MQRNVKFILLTISPLLMIALQTSHAQPFFKWIDENGATHYTQTPPQQKSSQQLTFNSTQKPSYEKPIEIMQSIQTRDNCTKLKKTVADYSNGVRSTQVESNGEVSLMIDGQKIVGARGLAAQYAKDCGYGNQVQ
ncbi:MAG: DUF4124 domain-containing protein [Candidatus Saccharibacteria bacterium]|nr:DUF4124 domain-containing protein [Moraxellaceae bacterium]